MAQVICDVSLLRRFLLMLRKGAPSVKIGVIGDKATAQHKTAGGHIQLTNALLAFVHEFGKKSAPKIPARSFIKMPLELHLTELLSKKKALTQAAMERAIRAGCGEEFSRKIGIVAEECIQTAFRTRGYGDWKTNAPSTIKAKGSDAPLIDTGELRRSITSEVVKEGKC